MCPLQRGTYRKRPNVTNIGAIKQASAAKLFPRREQSSVALTKIQLEDYNRNIILCYV